MEKEFVPFELAVKLKELGFDEPCFARYRKGKFQLNTLGKPYKYNLDEIVSGDVSAPLWQQAFDWFRDKYNLHCILHKSFYGYFIDIIRITDFASELHEKQLPHQEARQACLEKLIELVK